jgi:hypothetical protein
MMATTVRELQLLLDKMPMDAEILVNDEPLDISNATLASWRYLIMKTAKKSDA